jgi:voltage-gated sodium channel
MVEQPLAWIFFLVFILVSTFTVLNLFIAVVVNAMQEQVASEMQADEEARERVAHDERRQLLDEVRALRAEVAALRGDLVR